MKATRSNLNRAMKLAITLACRLVHGRDRERCVYCGRLSGKIDAAHIVPRGAGWWYASDPDNIVCLCREHHDALDGRGYAQIAEHVRNWVMPRRKIVKARYRDKIKPVAPSDVQARIDRLEREIRDNGW